MEKAFYFKLDLVGLFDDVNLTNKLKQKDSRGYEKLCLYLLKHWNQNQDFTTPEVIYKVLAYFQEIDKCAVLETNFPQQIIISLDIGQRPLIVNLHYQEY